MMNAMEYAQQASTLFAIPEIAVKIKSLSDSGTADLPSISHIIEKDPGLAAHVLKIANSSVYGFSRKVESLERALMIIGTDSVYEFALAFAIADTLDDKQSNTIDSYKYWSQSLTCAFICRSIAKVTEQADPARLFMAGLFHNVGELAVLRVNPSIVSQCRCFNEDVYPRTVQENLLGFTFAEVSASLLQKWRIPDLIVSTVAMQHHEQHASTLLDAKVLQLAYKLSLVSTNTHLYSFHNDVPEFLYESLPLDTDDVIAIGVESDKLTQKAISLFT